MLLLLIRESNPSMATPGVARPDPTVETMASLPADRLSVTCIHPPESGRRAGFQRLPYLESRVTEKTGPMTKANDERLESQTGTDDTDIDPRWRKLAEGTLSDEEAAALREEALETEEGRTLYEIYRPFDEVEDARLFEAVRARLRERRS